MDTERSLGRAQPVFLSFREVIAALGICLGGHKDLGKTPDFFSLLQTGGCYLILVLSSSPAWTHQLLDGILPTHLDYFFSFFISLSEGAYVMEETSLTIFGRGLGSAELS